MGRFGRRKKSLTELQEEIKTLKKRRDLEVENQKAKKLKKEIHELKFGKTKKTARRIYDRFSRNIIDNF